MVKVKAGVEDDGATSVLVIVSANNSDMDGTTAFIVYGVCLWVRYLSPFGRVVYVPVARFQFNV